MSDFRLTTAACLAAAPTLFNGSATAADCDGYTIAEAAAPILLRETPDGRTVSWTSDQRIIINSRDSPTSRAAGACGGGWSVSTDGKSGVGHGFCTYVDIDGDAWHITYRGEFAGGTWETVGGTGKFSNYQASGTWKPSGPYQFNNGWRSAEWAGECNL